MWLFEFVIGNVTIPSQVIEYDQNFLQADHPDCTVLLVEETGVPRENHRPTKGHWQTLSHNVVLSTPRLSGIQTNVSGDRHW
jgi:hypothetical protein